MRGRLRRSTIAAALTVVSVVSACTGVLRPDESGPTADPGAGRGVTVSQVVDGDTIRVLRDGGEERIRLIGVNAPEVDWYGGTGECFGEQAGRFLRRLLTGRRVLLEPDRESTDRYGRTLAYVHIEGGDHVNLLLVREGYAVVTIYPPNDRYEEELRAAEAAARRDRRGLWSACGR